VFVAEKRGTAKRFKVSRARACTQLHTLPAHIPTPPTPPLPQVPLDGAGDWMGSLSYDSSIALDLRPSTSPPGLTALLLDGPFLYAAYAAKCGKGVPASSNLCTPSGRISRWSFNSTTGAVGPTEELLLDTAAAGSSGEESGGERCPPAIPTSLVKNADDGLIYASFSSADTSAWLPACRAPSPWAGTTLRLNPFNKAPTPFTAGHANLTRCVRTHVRLPARGRRPDPSSSLSLSL